MTGRLAVTPGGRVSSVGEPALPTTGSNLRHSISRRRHPMNSSRRAIWSARGRCALVLALSALSSVSGGLAAADVVIHEIHFQPEDKTVPEEFIELHNSGDEPADISGWFLSDGVRFAFPGDTVIEPGGYLVVAEDPATIEATLGAAGALGPWEGRLANDGETVILRDASGRIVDEVDYGVRFPWPVATTGRGSSLERVHPSLDGSLGGSWRASGYVEVPPREREYFLAAESDGWRYRKGTSEASTPATAWREPDFEEDGSWLPGQTSVGYGDDDDNTVLDDMEDSYTGIFLRHEFTVTSSQLADLPPFLLLRVYSDDGAAVWINGREAGRFKIAEGEIPFDATATTGREARWEDALVPNPGAYLREGRNVVAVRAVNRSIGSSDFSIDIEVLLPGTEDLEAQGFQTLPTPGAPNSVAASNAAPQVRKVRHGPDQPSTADPIVVTALVTDPDGVGEVLLRYQIVRPGHYLPAWLPLPHSTLLSRPTTDLEPNPEFEDPASWLTVRMVDDGTAPDLLAGDGLYAGLIEPQENRTLVRYRITVADALGVEGTVPGQDDPSLNFACFVYDGVPAYTTTRRSVHPDGTGHVWPEELMRSLPVYFLITRKEDLDRCISYSGSYQIPKSNEEARDKFNWEGAFVYEGVVYDHIRYRLRQANDRYGGSGKRSFRIRFNRGYYLQARDNYGRPYSTRWRTLNTGKMFDNKRVGNFGLTESMNHELWNMVGVPAPFTHTFHWRVIQREEEAPLDANGQYYGDFYGMHLVFEDYDPRFLDAHGLADGTLYKLKDGIFSGDELRRNQGRYAVTTDADFQNIRRSLRPQQSEAWLNAHVNYGKWYPYHAVVEGIRHYDFRPSDTHSKNRAWFFEPIYDETPYGRLWTLPWDSDASWGPNWNEGIDYSKNAIFANGGKPAFKQAYRNCLREFRDLVWTEEVIHQMIDDLAGFVLEFSQADRDRWRGAPSDAGTQDFGAITTKIADMKRFAFVSWSGSTGPTVPAGGRARHLDNLANAEGDLASMPDTPDVTPLTPGEYPKDRLRFAASAFSDPQGPETFAGIEWRVGEIHDPEAPGHDPYARRVYEVPAVWTSGVIPDWEPLVEVPGHVVRVGHTYRIRVRMLDTTGRASHWSAPAEFTVAEPTGPSGPEAWLRVSEIMYHPERDSGYEYIELQNIGPEPIDLDHVSFRSGIEFDFATAEIRTLGAGERLVLVANLPVFATLHDVESIPVAGEYAGRLDNAGEALEIGWGEDGVVQRFEYDDEWYPSTDGIGHSLVITDPTLHPALWSFASSWRPSARPGGSPGQDDVEPLGGRQVPGDLNQDANLDISDPVAILQLLFLGRVGALPCGDGTLDAQGNLALLDSDASGGVNLTDAIYLLSYLFLSGPPPALGVHCVEIEGCPDTCGP